MPVKAPNEAKIARYRRSSSTSVISGTKTPTAQRKATWWSLLPGAMVNISANTFIAPGSQRKSSSWAGSHGSGYLSLRPECYDGGAGIQEGFYAGTARRRHRNPLIGIGRLHGEVVASIGRI